MISPFLDVIASAVEGASDGIGWRRTRGAAVGKKRSENQGCKYAGRKAHCGHHEVMIRICKALLLEAAIFYRVIPFAKTGLSLAGDSISQRMVGEVLGSDLGVVADRVGVIREVVFRHAGIASSTVEGHVGKSVFGKLTGTDVILMEGLGCIYT